MSTFTITNHRNENIFVAIGYSRTGGSEGWTKIEQNQSHQFTADCFRVQDQNGNELLPFKPEKFQKRQAFRYYLTNLTTSPSLYSKNFSFKLLLPEENFALSTWTLGIFGEQVGIQQTDLMPLEDLPEGWRWDPFFDVGSQTDIFVPLS